MSTGDRNEFRFEDQEPPWRGLDAARELRPSPEARARIRALVRDRLSRRAAAAHRPAFGLLRPIAVPAPLAAALAVLAAIGLRSLLFPAAEKHSSSVPVESSQHVAELKLEVPRESGPHVETLYLTGVGELFTSTTQLPPSRFPQESP